VAAPKPYDRTADPTRPNNDESSWDTPLGLVAIYAPTGAVPYYRIVWGNPQEGTTAGRTFERAWAKALAREQLILAGATPRTEQATNVGIDYWLSPERPKPRGPWGESHTKTMTYYAARYFRTTFGGVPLLELRRSHIQQAVNLAPTENEGRNVRRAARSLLGALRQGDYLLETQMIDLTTVWWHGERKAKVTEQGEDKANYVPRDKRPTHIQVNALRDASTNRRRRGSKSWRPLAIELAAYSGVRRGELAVLDDTTVFRDGRVRVQWRLETIGGPHLALPKGNKRRWTTYPKVTPTGFPLAEAIGQRLDEVAKEKKSGANPKGLLFPSERGTWLLGSNFHRDVFEPAALDAGWPYVEETKPWGVGKTRHQRTWALTWHSLRHTFVTWQLEDLKQPPSRVAALAGHESPEFTISRYVSGSNDDIDDSLAALGWRTVDDSTSPDSTADSPLPETA
jgi:integrase